MRHYDLMRELGDVRESLRMANRIAPPLAFGAITAAEWFFTLVCEVPQAIYDFIEGWADSGYIVERHDGTFDFTSEHYANNVGKLFKLMNSRS